MDLPARKAALVWLSDLEKDKRPISQLPAAPPFEDPRERGLFRELTQGVLRHRSLLDWHIAALSNRPLTALKPQVHAALRLGLYQLIFLTQIPEHAAVHETVNLLDTPRLASAKGYANALMRRFLREDRRSQVPEDLASRESCPEELLKTLREGLAWAHREPGELSILCKTFNQPPTLCLRVNTLRTSREEAIAAIKHSQPEAVVKPTTVSPVGILVSGIDDLRRLPGFLDGHFFVQSESSQLVAPLLGPFSASLRVLDACAAPGGKTTHLAELMGDKGSITALSPTRHSGKRATDRLRENVTRGGYRSITVIEETAEAYAAANPTSKFDRILVDAPCSGLGTIAKHPERKFAFRRHHADTLAKEQRSILQAVTPLLAPNGILVVSLCSLAVPEWTVALESLQCAKPVELPFELPSRQFVEDRGCFIFWPQDFGSEGMFACRRTAVT